jgi:autotransporter strand-loop-strand O-heptosyltransferase
MKVINVTPGLLPIPPNGWGAVEKIIWDYHLELDKNGIKNEIKYLNDVSYDDSVIVHVHVANLANQCAERKIPYIFSIHDHHAFLHGKDSRCFKENLQAIENSVISISPCKFLVNYFESEKLRYLSHAVNTNIFKYKPRAFNNKLLCVANNGYATDKSYDRKGFKPAIEAAIEIGMEITIAGPENNKNFFETLPANLNEYSGLKKVFNLNEQQLIELYNEHSIFVHLSELEAGHPNLTILEAMSCGLPVVGTFEENSYDGMAVTEERSKEHAVGAISKIKNNFEEYRESAIKNANKNSYSNRVKDLVSIYSEYREKIFANRFLQSYRNTRKSDAENKYIISFINGAKVEILGKFDRKYNVVFIDTDNDEVVYEATINNNMWSVPAKSYFVNWKVKIFELKENGEKQLVCEKTLNLRNQKVKINLETKSLGDIIAFVDSVDRFQKKHECILDCVILNKDLVKSLKDNYKNINFFDSERSNNGYYASYDVGYFFENWENKAKVNPRTVKLTHVPSHILGIDHKEGKPILSFKGSQKPKNKYVCIATQSTSQCKYWNNKNGWDDVISFLNKKGYDVWCIDKHKYFGNGKSMNKTPEKAIDKTGDFPIQERMAQIKNAEFFIGLGSGLSWLAWALDKPVVLISGFSKPLAEFYTPYRVINENVCNGCWNDPDLTFDRSNWNWCPRNKDFECTKQITPSDVINQIDKIISTRP